VLVELNSIFLWRGAEIKMSSERFLIVDLRPLLGLSRILPSDKI